MSSVPSCHAAGALPKRGVRRRQERSDREAYDKLAFATMEELAARGIRAELWQQQPSLAPAPVLLIGIERYDAGSRGLRWLCGPFGCGEAVVFVMIDMRSAPQGRPVLVGRVEGWVRSGWYGGNAVMAAEEAGHAIGCTVARGSALRCGGFSRSAKTN